MASWVSLKKASQGMDLLRVLDRAVGHVLQVFHVFRLESIRRERVSDGALLEQDLVPHAGAAIFAVRVGVMAVHPQLSGFGVPAPTRVKRVRLIGQGGSDRRRSIE